MTIIPVSGSLKGLPVRKVDVSVRLEKNRLSLLLFSKDKKL